MSAQRGRLTEAQRRGIQTVLPTYALDCSRALDAPHAYGRRAPLGVEIGFGTGEALLHWAEVCPDWNLVGIEIYPPGVGALANRLLEAGVGNVRIAQARAEEVVGSVLVEASVEEFRIYFPDPWPKKRHHKRRLIQPAFVEMLAGRLRPGGLIRLATDWAPYAEWSATILDAATGLRRRQDEEPSSRPETRFERRGRRLGHDIFEFCYVRSDD